MKYLLIILIMLISGITMETNAKGIDLIKNAETLQLTPYICPAGKLTVGYGHTGKFAAKAISVEEANRLLKVDLINTEKAIDKVVKVPLTSNQFSALVSFVFNVGTGAFNNSTMLKLLNSGDYVGASGQFDRWIHANGKPLKGLINRRNAEQALFLAKDGEA